MTVWARLYVIEFCYTVELCYRFDIAYYRFVKGLSNENTFETLYLNVEFSISYHLYTIIYLLFLLC